MHFFYKNIEIQGNLSNILLKETDPENVVNVT